MFNLHAIGTNDQRFVWDWFIFKRYIKKRETTHAIVSFHQLCSRGSKRVDALKNTLPTGKMQSRCTNMQRDEIFAISTKSFVNVKSILCNLTIRSFRARNRFVEEWKPFPCMTVTGNMSEREKKIRCTRRNSASQLTSIISHGNARGWHDRHESIECIMGYRTRRIFPCSVSLQMHDVVRITTEQTIGKSRSY